jgi:hypothetical protein
MDVDDADSLGDGPSYAYALPSVYQHVECRELDTNIREYIPVRFRPKGHIHSRVDQRP